LGPIFLPEFRASDARRLDPRSAALSLLAVLALIYGLKQIAEGGLRWPPVACVFAGVAIGLAFLRRQGNLADPLIDLRLFRRPVFSAALATNTITLFAGFGVFIFTAQYMQLVLGLSPMAAGLAMLPSSLALVIGSMLAPQVVRWMRPATAIAAGLSLAAVGFAMLTHIGNGSELAIVVTGSSIHSLGMAAAVTLSTDLIVGAAPPERAGAVAAISETGTELGGALGIAILGSIGTAMYRHAMARVHPGLSPQVQEAARATISRAIEAAEHLPAPLRAELLDQARAAFSQALKLTALLSAAVVIAMAMIVTVLLRFIPSRREADQQSRAGIVGPRTGPQPVT
jgi:DHA2 family multidrug resistance protein-like MFS transporter